MSIDLAKEIYTTHYISIDSDNKRVLYTVMKHAVIKVNIAYTFKRRLSIAERQFWLKLPIAERQFLLKTKSFLSIAADASHVMLLSVHAVMKHVLV